MHSKPSLWLMGGILINVVLIAAVGAAGLFLLSRANPAAGQVTILAGVVGVCLALMLGGSFAFYKTVAKPLSDLAQATEAYVNGDAEALITRLESQGARRGDVIGKLVGHLGQAIQASRERQHWYEQILDALPFPISVTDSQMNWTFINRPVEEMLKVKRAQVLGKPCHNWGAGICKTENCGIQRLRRNLQQTLFDQLGRNFQVHSAYLRSSRGEVAGHIEVVQDITQLSATGRYSTQAVEQLAGYLAQMAGGDLGFEMAPLPEANEFTQEVRQNFQRINNNLAQARAMLASAVQSVTENANNVSAASSQLALSSSQAGQATAQIATTVQQVATGTAQQSEGVMRTADLLSQVNKVVERVSQGAKDQAEAVARATAVTQKITAQDGISEQVNRSAKKVQEMGDRSQQISTIVETIEDIAGQTNLLALNAAIEAARAGEHGKGFAVVADEVRKLAEKSAAATKEISGLIRDIQGTVSDAVTMANSAAADINVASEELIAAIDSVSTVVNENLTASEQISKSSQHALEAMENIAAVSEENGAAVEEVSASAEEMNAQVEEVSASAHSLAEMATALQHAVAQFRVGAAAPAAQPAIVGGNGARPKNGRAKLSLESWN